MALLATEPLKADEMAGSLGQPVAAVERAFQQVADFYTQNDRGIRLVFVAGGWRFATADDLVEDIARCLVAEQSAKLSQAALETLAVIAYLQPVSRARIAGVRGVNVDGVVRTLVVRGLIREVGRDATTGAITFGTTELFLEKLGLASLQDLPDLAPLLPDAVALEAELAQLSKEDDRDRG